MGKSKERNIRPGKMGAWITGIIGSIIAGVLVVVITEGIQSSKGVEPNVDGSDPPAKKQVFKIWKQGSLTIPVSFRNTGQAADLDSGRLLMLGTSISARGADIIVRQGVHGIVFEPGLSKGDGITFDARFIAVNDASVGRKGCADAVISPRVSNHLGLSSTIDVGSHICMVTTNGRLAEFTITSVDLSRKSRQVRIKYVVWEK